MKKLFLFTLLSALTISLGACSSDDNNGSGSGSQGGIFKVTIDGVEKTFNTVDVTKDVPDEYGDVQLRVSASINGSPDEVITFTTWENETGTMAIYPFGYAQNGILYSDGTQTFRTNMSANSNNYLKGTFSGTLTSQSQPNVVFTNGSFEVRY